LNSTIYALALRVLSLFIDSLMRMC
jgi:hypothetical protein